MFFCKTSSDSLNSAIWPNWVNYCKYLKSHCINDTYSSSSHLCFSQLRFHNLHLKTNRGPNQTHFQKQFSWSVLSYCWSSISSEKPSPKKKLYNLIILSKWSEINLIVGINKNFQFLKIFCFGLLLKIQWRSTLLRKSAIISANCYRSMIFLFQNITKAISIWSMTFSKKLPRVKNFRVPIFRVLCPKIATFGPNQQVKKYYQK